MGSSICIRDILWIAYSSQPGAPAALRSFGAFGPGSPLPSLQHPLTLLCAAPQSQPPTGPPDAVCPAQTATAIGSPRRRCFSSCPTRNLAPRCWQSWCGMVGVELPRRKRGIKHVGDEAHIQNAHRRRGPHTEWAWVRARTVSARP